MDPVPRNGNRPELFERLVESARAERIAAEARVKRIDPALGETLFEDADEARDQQGHEQDEPNFSSIQARRHLVLFGRGHAGTSRDSPGRLFSDERVILQIKVQRSFGEPVHSIPRALEETRVFVEGTAQLLKRSGAKEKFPPVVAIRLEARDLEQVTLTQMREGGEKKCADRETFLSLFDLFPCETQPFVLVQLGRDDVLAGQIDYDHLFPIIAHHPLPALVAPIQSNREPDEEPQEHDDQHHRYGGTDSLKSLAFLASRRHSAASFKQPFDRLFHPPFDLLKKLTDARRQLVESLPQPGFRGIVPLIE